ncbi:MAG: nucleotide-binding protein [Planctomycetota bacterium]
MQRHRVPELMDAPDLDPALHHHALQGLARIHTLTQTHRPLLKRLTQHLPTLRTPSPDQPFQILDLPAGGGDLLLRYHQHANRHQLPWQLHAADLSPTALNRITQTFQAHQPRSPRIESVGSPSPTLHQLNALTDPLPPNLEAITCTLFLHHLDPDDATTLLRRLAAAAPLLILHDLNRSRIAYHATQLATRLITRSPIVHHDGPASVRAAYTPEELHQLATAANINPNHLTIQRQFPFRMTLTHQHPQ